MSSTLSPVSRIEFLCGNPELCSHQVRHQQPPNGTFGPLGRPLPILARPDHQTAPSCTVVQALPQKRVGGILYMLTAQLHNFKSGHAGDMISHPKRKSKACSHGKGDDAGKHAVRLEAKRALSA